MNMKMQNKSRRCADGNALLITMIMTVAALLTVAGIMSWSSSTARMTGRSNQYSRSVAAAEAATEKAMSHLNADFLSGGEALVDANLATYRSLIPTSSDSSYWANWRFTDAQGNVGQTYVNEVGVSNFTVLTAPYAGLYGYISTYDLVSDASEVTNLQSTVAGVFEEVQLTRIPIFQFGMYSADDMEISCGKPLYIDGPVHSNGSLYTEPDNIMTFAMLVSAVNQIYFAREPLDGRGTPTGSVVFMMGAVSNAASLTLPIGTTNTSAAIQQVIQPPPVGEDPLSPLGRVRYYNQVDMIINVTPTGVSATSGRFNSFITAIPTNELALFVSTTNTFYDSRESKTVQVLDLNVGMLTKWSATNQDLRFVLGNRDVSSVYVKDTRTASATILPAVRVWNGVTLPSLGLTVATSRPLYVWGNYNQTNAANLNTTNTTTTRPASLVADAVTVLSPAWTDANSSNLLALRIAVSDTLNAAIISGSVYTTLSNYSGGMENFQRYLESWTLATATYNGSLVKMFASVYATNNWGKANVYNPPSRNYYFDPSYNNPSKLPPLTPSLQTISRNRWATIAANQVVATNTPW
jgi:hypothetical protein